MGTTYVPAFHPAAVTETAWILIKGSRPFFCLRYASSNALLFAFYPKLSLNRGHSLT